jgi:hypothetical protein
MSGNRKYLIRIDEQLIIAFIRKPSIIESNLWGQQAHAMAVE